MSVKDSNDYPLETLIKITIHVVDQPLSQAN